MALVPAVRVWPTWAVPVMVGSPAAGVLGAGLVSASRNRSSEPMPVRTGQDVEVQRSGLADGTLLKFT